MSSGRPGALARIGTLTAAAREVAPRRVAERLLPRVVVRAAGDELLSRVSAPVVFAANHASPLDAGFVAQAAPSHLGVSTLPAAAAVRLGRSVVVFPERGVTPDGSLGAFHDDALAAASAGGLLVVPTAIRGSFGLDRAPGRLSTGRPPVVLVRFGDPLPAPDADTLRAAVASLLTEDAGTWWRALGASATAHGDQPADGAADGAAEGSASGWLAAWEHLAPAERPGENQRPRIWR